MKLALLIPLLFLSAIAFGADATANRGRPNIVIILADDVGFSDLGCYGGEIRTPNLDALASHGVRFTQFYNCARCCPSRTCLLTGLYPHQAGVGLMTSDQGAKFPGAGDQGELFPGYRGSLNRSCVTIGQVLKTVGYRTAAAGKWHVGDRELPTARGFDDFYGFVSGYAVDSWEPRMMIRLPEGNLSAVTSRASSLPPMRLPIMRSTCWRTCARAAHRGFCMLLIRPPISPCNPNPTT